jgi:hypothetical protein
MHAQMCSASGGVCLCTVAPYALCAIRLRLYLCVLRERECVSVFVLARAGEFETGFDRGGQTREHARLLRSGECAA